MANDEAKLFEDIVLEDGRKARICIASDECRKQNIRYLQRGEMIDHLSTIHHITASIPKRKTGRPLGARIAKIRKPACEKQARVRFQDPEYKFQRNMKMQEARETKKACMAWDALEEAEKLLEGPKEAYVKGKVTNAIQVYLQDKASRMTLINKRINEGYNKHVS